MAVESNRQQANFGGWSSPGYRDLTALPPLLLSLPRCTNAVWRKRAPFVGCAQWFSLCVGDLGALEPVRRRSKNSYERRGAAAQKSIGTVRVLLLAWLMEPSKA
ncbi:uncharacterized protein SPSK_03762 [Sporothrix schenckii 1099-18]|uniref:Uncharacterized protein n=1 Tax=Sporothrix schenckii 1099-18 TaxID=1397361 RepID=A0A0F2LZL2_SPOSC|nr:uncharacterized protein SPSK_03762 [Sporothrix schenckii 1099-18]KJR82274.1 hypothetical protein SPSK_03762 [Sporothrix schenckii 1099-18]